MKIKPRRMRKFTPRRRKNTQTLKKQQLKDCEHLLNMDLGSYLILSEEGTSKQAEKARIKMRTDLLKYGADMEKIAREMGATYPEMVKDFLASLKKIAGESGESVDPAPVKEHQNISDNLLNMLKEGLQ